MKWQGKLITYLCLFIIADSALRIAFLSYKQTSHKHSQEPAPKPSVSIATPAWKQHTGDPNKPKEPKQANPQSKPVTPGFMGPLRYSNRSRFFKDGFHWIAQRECGKCLLPCHDDENDKGGITCIGMAEHFNTTWYVTFMNNIFNKCMESVNDKGQYVLTCVGVRHPIQEVKQRYFALYYMEFISCPWAASMIITDSAITSGQRTAVRLLQKSAGLKVDGVFGPKSLQACKHFDSNSYLSYERARYKSLKQCPRYCKGWLKRVRLKEKRFGK